MSPRQPSLLKLSSSNVGLPASSFWVCYAEQFFEYQWTAEDQKVMIFSFHYKWPFNGFSGGRRNTKNYLGGHYCRLLVFRPTTYKDFDIIFQN